MELSGGAALVTGGASGMGRATAQRLAAEGMQVCVVDIDGSAAEAVARSLGGMALGVDVSDVRQLEGAFDACLERFGRLDLAYLNAGVTTIDMKLLDLDIDRFHRAVGVNVEHIAFGTKFAVEAMLQVDRARRGAIVVTASLAGMDPFYGDPVYTLTKHAAVGFVRAVAPDLAADGIAAHAICPGITDTGMVSDGTRAFLDSAGVPLISSEAIADVVIQAATAPLELAGSCWAVHPDRPAAPFEFTDATGAHTALNKHR